MIIGLSFLEKSIKNHIRKQERAAKRMMNFLSTRLGFIIMDGEIDEDELLIWLNDSSVKLKLGDKYKDFLSMSEAFLASVECVKRLNELKKQYFKKIMKSSHYLGEFLDVKSARGFYKRVIPGQLVQVALLQIQQSIVRGELSNAENAVTNPETCLNVLEIFKVEESGELKESERMKLFLSFEIIANLNDKVIMILEHFNNYAMNHIYQKTVSTTY